jgi:hypothetical protein
VADVKMTAEAAARVNGRFEDLSAEFVNTMSTISGIAEQAEAGAGEFAGSISSGSSAFAIAWREAFDVCGTTAAIIAGNTNRFSVDLGRLDRDASTTIQL